MSFQGPYTTTYGSYQAPYQSYSSGHYPAQYGQVPAPLFPPFPPNQPRSSPPPHDLPPAPPDLTSITPKIASQAIERLLTAELRQVGFNSAQPAALRRLELEVIALVENLYERAHEYANLANRAGPITKDLMLACEECKLQPNDLHTSHSRRSKKGSTEIFEALNLLPPPSRTPSPELLPSDDEGAPPVIPVTLRTLPNYFPNLPPKHTYLRTPASPPKKAAIPSLDKKLKNAGLVQESLRNLLVATDDSSGQEDGELLGHIVNWEASSHPRKRWKSST